MKRTITFITVLFLFAGLFSGCEEDDGVSSSGLAGSYVLAYMKHLQENFTLYAGQDNNIEGMIITISGSLTLTESTYNMQMTTIATVYGQTETDSETDQGTYTTSGNALTITDSRGDVTNLTYTLNGDALILNDGEMEIGFNRQ